VGARYGNHLARVVFPEPTREFVVTVELNAKLVPINPFDFYVEPSASTWPFAYEPDLREELEPCLATEHPGPKLDAWIDAVPRERTDTVELLVGMGQRFARDIAYEKRMTPGLQSFEETLRLGSGSCRDSAWLLVQILRHLDIAARFASGYLIQLDPDVAELHAWAEAYIPGAGWIGIDPTSGFLAGEGHLPLACSPKPERAAPVSGLVGRSDVRFEHRIAIARIDSNLGL
jgi:transglutaminase-like putative cysteine protease